MFYKVLASLGLYSGQAAMLRAARTRAMPAQLAITNASMLSVSLRSLRRLRH